MLDKAKNRGMPRPYLRNLNVRWFDFDLSDLSEMRFEADEEERYTVRKGDLVICEGGYPGRAAIWSRSEPIHFQKALHRVRFHEPAHAKWCLYYLLSEDLAGRLSRNFNGAGIQHFTGEALARFRIPVPPTVDLNRIVAILDEAFEGIATAKANAEKNLQNARELFRRQHEQVFAELSRTSDRARLGDLAAFRNGINYTKQSKGSAVRVVGVKNFQDHLWAPLHDLDTVTMDGELNDADALAEGDILAVRSNGNPELIGRTMVVGPMSERVSHSGFTIRIRLLRDDVLPLYVCQFMRSLSVRRQLVDGGTGTNIRSLNQGALSAIQVPVPAMHKQEAAVKAIDAVGREAVRLAELVRRKLATLDELKQSLLHQAFTGQLTSAKPASVAVQATLQPATPEFAANVIALAHARHERQRRDKTFGHVKAQKLLHLVEAIAKIDLGRRPMRDAAGPNDSSHMRKAEEWAKAHGFFEMVKRGEGYEFRKLSSFDQRLTMARQVLAPCLPQLERVIDLLVPMDTEEAEVFATVHAAWNNLLIDGADATDDAIIAAARGGWHADKLEIPVHKFRTAIASIRQQQLVPDGTAKYVGGQQPLL